MIIGVKSIMVQCETTHAAREEGFNQEHFLVTRRASLLVLVRVHICIGLGYPSDLGNVLAVL